MQIATKTTVISLLNDDILLVKFLDNDEEIDLQEAKAQLDAANTISGGKKMLVLIDARQSIHEFSNDAKEFIANVNVKKAEAMLVKELHQRIIATFYLKLSGSKHAHPVKVFSNETEAINWLLSFK
jgi:hypothetical protein